MSLFLLAAPAPAADGVARTSAEALTARADRELERRSVESLPRAVALYEEAVELWRQAGDAVAETRTTINLAMAYRRQGELRHALAAYQRALTAARGSGEIHLEARALLHIGNVYCWIGEGRQAIARLQEARELLNRHPDEAMEADVLFQLAVAHERLGEYQEALERYDEVLTRFRAAGNRLGEAATLNNLGTVAFEMGRFRESRAFYLQVVELRQELGDDAGQARALAHLAMVDNELGKSRRALAYSQRALDLVRAAGDRSAEANTLNTLGLAWLLMEEPERARAPLEQALKLSRELPAPRIEARSLRLMGRMHAALGRPAAAVERFAQAVAANRATGHLLGLADALAALASQRRQLGELDAALEAMGEALAIFESLRTRTTRHELRTSFFSSRRAAYELYVGLLMAKHRSEPGGGYDAAALEAAERARARTLLDQLTESGIDLHDQVDRELLRHERELAQRLDAREEERLRAASGSTARIETEIAELLTELRRVRGRIRYQSPRYAALAMPEPVDLATIRERLLDRETVLVSYLLGEERSFVWAVASDRLVSRDLPPRAAIEAVALRLYELVTARNRPLADEMPSAWRQRIAHADAEVTEAARALSRLVLEPVAGGLDRRRLVVVADGLLQVIPFAILPRPGKSEPLITRHEVVHLPSASTLAVLRQRRGARPRPTRELAVVADPVFRDTDPRRFGAPSPAIDPDRGNERSFRPPGAGDSSALGRLRFSRLEAERLVALLPPDEATTFLDLAASRANVLSPELGRYRLLHFATHALVDDEHPELSALALSRFDERGEPQPGFVRLHEVYSLRLAADLVTLSACETALGKPVDGEGLIGLVRGFLHAGADRVVASLWSVRDKATAELMSRFYRALLVDGEYPATALRQAQITLRADRRFNAPYFWAPFVLQGEWY